MAPKRNDKWYGIDIQFDSSTRQTTEEIFCKGCLTRFKFKVSKQALNNAKKYHFPPGSLVCQGKIRAEQGVNSLFLRPLARHFGGVVHYGRVVYQHQELIETARGVAPTNWRVQYEDGEEFDQTFAEILACQAVYRRNLPKNLAGEPRQVVVPYERGEEGRDGATAGNRGAVGEESEDEEEEDEDEEDDDFGEMFYSDADDVPPQYHDPNAGSLIPTRSHEYLTAPVCQGSPVTALTQILQTLRQRRGKNSNRGVIDGFIREIDAYGASLPRSWPELLKDLGVPPLEKAVRHMCAKGHHVWRYVSKDSYGLLKEDQLNCPVCKLPRFKTVKGKLVPVRVMYYFRLQEVLQDLFLLPEWCDAWKKDLDISDNGVHQSKRAKFLNELFGGAVLKDDSGLYSLWD